MPKTDELPSQKKDYDEITYIPGEGDPIRTKWNGFEFRAHLPVQVPHKATVLVPMPLEMTAADGSRITRHVEKRVPMADLARGNPAFSVNGETPAKRRLGTARVPTNSDEYRGYCISWIAASTKPADMDARWEAEQELREVCGCDDNDIAYLRPFFEARHEQTKAA